MVEPSNTPADVPSDVPPPGQVVRTKRQKTDPSQPASDMVRLIPISKQPDVLRKEWRPVRLNKDDLAPGMTLGDEQLSVTSTKGYRMVRGTHGVHSGTHYYEVTITHLGESGHCRVGWSTKQAELQAPVGYDHQSFSYRDLEGCKVHKGLREEYGASYTQGDVVGCVIHIPEGGRALEATAEDVVQWKGGLYVKQENTPDPQPLPESFVGFTKNGVWQGMAYETIPEGTYYPAISIYTLPHQREGATVTVNFGPTFAHPPPALPGGGTVTPMSDVAGPPPAPAAAQGTQEEGGVKGEGDA